MTSNTDDKSARYQYRRAGTICKNSNIDEKEDNNGIVNRRHSLAHINFRKAVYRSLSLPEEDDESNNIPISYMKYFIKFLFVCLIIVLIGSLIKLLHSYFGRKQ